jgi:hypothetical protein
MINIFFSFMGRTVPAALAYIIRGAVGQGSRLFAGVPQLRVTGAPYRPEDKG